jgi:hypothetical protein
MLWDASEMKGYAIAGSDGHLGTVSDFLFDDTSWKVRWLVVDVGHWFPGREVLLPVSALGRPDAAQRQFSVKLTVQQVQDSPDIDCDLPVSRQAEFTLTKHYDSDPYRTSKHRNAMRNASSQPIQSAGRRPRGACIIAPPLEHGDPHLRSIEAVLRYHVHLTDGEVGHVDDFLIEDATWSILYIKVDTRNWWPGKKVLIPLECAPEAGQIETAGLTRGRGFRRMEANAQTPLPQHRIQAPGGTGIHRRRDPSRTCQAPRRVPEPDPDLGQQVRGRRL